MEISDYGVALGMFLMLSSCCEDEALSKGKATVFPSYSTEISMTADFQIEKNDSLIFLRLGRLNERSLTEAIHFNRLPLREDSFKVFTRLFIPFEPKKLSSTFVIMEGDDAVGEEYLIDSSAVQNSSIVIENITNRCISGKFNLFFKAKEPGGFKLEPKIPDSFHLEGIFNAEKFR